MVVGVLQFDIFIPDAQSLKDKRRIVVSLKDKLHRHHRVSVAEVDRQEKHQRAVLAVALISNDTSHAQSSLDRIVDQLREDRRFVMTDYKVEMIVGR